MKVSIIIPVYNEASQLGACLRAIANQTVKPHEVIVVDNNSSDLSIKVANAYDFVTVVREPKQGVLHARTTGFDFATGDIIARIDADSLLPDDWIRSVAAVFEDSSIDAVSGTAQYYNVAAAGLFNAIDLFFRRRLSRQLGDRVFLWGANMAIRREAWRRVKSRLCNQGGIHEDFDIAIHLQEIGGRVVFDERMSAQVSSRRIDTGFVDFMSYVWASPRTYAKHHIRSRWHMYSPVIVCAVGYLPARIMHRGYDPKLERFSWSRVFASSGGLQRVDPTTNVA